VSKVQPKSYDSTGKPCFDKTVSYSEMGFRSICKACFGKTVYYSEVAFRSIRESSVKANRSTHETPALGTATSTATASTCSVREQHKHQ
jgi:hypothetical protein